MFYINGLGERELLYRMVRALDKTYVKIRVEQIRQEIERDRNTKSAVAR